LPTRLRPSERIMEKASIYSQQTLQHFCKPVQKSCNFATVPWLLIGKILELNNNLLKIQ